MVSFTSSVSSFLAAMMLSTMSLSVTASVVITIDDLGVVLKRHTKVEGG